MSTKRVFEIVYVVQKVRSFTADFYHTLAFDEIDEVHEFFINLILNKNKARADFSEKIMKRNVEISTIETCNSDFSFSDITLEKNFQYMPNIGPKEKHTKMLLEDFCADK